MFVPPSDPAPPRLTCTELERLGLQVDINLSDAHARLPLTAGQQRIVARLPELFAQAREADQEELEERFCATFFALAGQGAVAYRRPPMLSYSASSATRMVAACLRRRTRRVLLVEPCFDNIARLIAGEGLELTAVPERVLEDPDLLDPVAGPLAGPGTEAGALWIVSPNNPTGRTVSEATLSRLAERCRERGMVLVCDCCFRFFSDTQLGWDQYAVLAASGTSFAVIEDTGKTWPTLDVKVGITVTSDDLHPALFALHDDLLLNVSPLHLVLLGCFLDDSLRHGLDHTVRDTVATNRRSVSTLLERPGVRAATDSGHNVPLAWLEALAPLDVDALRAGTRRRGVELLPGLNFFWSSAGAGRPYFRLALSRPQDDVERGVAVLGEVVDTLVGARR